MRKIISVLMFLGIVLMLIDVVFALDPIPDIKANNSNGPITITPNDSLLITVELNPGSYEDNNSDWWVAAYTPFDWYHYDVTGGSCSWIQGLSVTHQGPLFNLTPVEVLNIPGLPTGIYTFYFGVDTIMNCSLDYNQNQLYYDSVEVNVIDVNDLVYQWLYQQQDNNSALLASQENDSASTYNNALAVMAFTLKNDKDSLLKAKRILDYFNDRCNDLEFYTENKPRGFFQYRSAETGQPDTNSNRWMGDNAWLLMAIHHYEASTGDTTYTSMAEAIVNLLISFQQPDGYIASGWEGEIFNSIGHAEGNLNAYRALLLYGETEAAGKIKDWLDFNDLDWGKGPLDLHSWRVLSLGANYGFCISDTERIDDENIRYKCTIDYNNCKVIGFLPFTYMDNNIWSEGTGQMAVSFYKAGYKKYGDYYMCELEKLLFEPKDFPGTLTVSFLALSDLDYHPWVDTNKGHVAGVCWYIFAENRFDPFDGVTMNSFQIKNPICKIEAEGYDTSDGGVRLDDRGVISEGKAIHIAGDSGSSSTHENSGWVEYSFNVLPSITNATIKMRYADDVQGDTCKIFLDSDLITSFNTKDTGTWDDYEWTNSFSVGSLEPGLHTLKVEGKDNKTYGFTIDCFRIDGEATEI